MNEPNRTFAPLAGLALDAWAGLKNEPFVPHSLTKLRNILYCRKATGADTVIEIGTYKGVTARRLSRHFKRVISVEIVPALHDIAKRTCAGHDNIELLLGDGKDLLDVVSSQVKNAVLFLDGHYSGGQTGFGEEPEPVLSELDVIRDRLGNYAAIIVDDFRLFGVERGWPRKSEVLQKLEAYLPYPEWQHTVLNDQFITTRRSHLL